MGTIRIGIITLLTIGQLAGSAVSVAAQDDEAVVVSGGMSPIGGASVPCELEEDFTELDDGTASWTWCFGLVMDDPRLTGDGSVVMAERAYDGFGLISSRVEIANEGGSWSGNGTRVFIDGDPGIDIEQLVLSGAGGYGGLTAILYADPEFGFRGLDSWNGVIVSGEMPGLPAE